MLKACYNKRICHRSDAKESLKIFACYSHYFKLKYTVHAFHTQDTNQKINNEEKNLLKLKLIFEFNRFG